MQTFERIIPLFNENRSCIEILSSHASQLLNQCLMKTEVVLKYELQSEIIQNLITFNENRSCIEIQFVFLPFLLPPSLMKTEVVLKCNSCAIGSCVLLCLMKTEVVLKFVS